ncbi:tRNA isopentenyltransferase [Backusella circina FSU 941]|nr:tRNA isopentenyltransferase [Backusella circina FSU 941]
MRKIAAVIGSSGIGKSKLAVELSKALHGQVINADSLQVYKGLDIITNKMPPNEREGIPHHLMSFLETDQEYKVTDFLTDASKTIESISSQDHLPVVVGGTHYYIQSLLWNNTLMKEEESRSPSPEPCPELDNLSTEKLYEELSKVDSVMANKWHPSDRRKILRSLKVFHSSGKPQSAIIQSQKEEGQQPRYKALVFWIYSDPAKLNPRLDDRVDQMIGTGLFDEIKNLRQQVVEGSIKTPDCEMEKYQRGIWQAIGYKEFDPYFTALESGTKGVDLDKIKLDCTERMKAATRRYAKRQIQWIRNKLLPTIAKTGSDDVVLYLLDAQDLDKWDVNVKDTAVEVAKAFCHNLPMPAPNSLSDIAATMLTPSDDAQDSQTKVLQWKKHTCDVCKTAKGDCLVLNGDLEWEQHKKSRLHRKFLKKIRVDEMRRQYMEKKAAEAACTVEKDKES